MNTNNFVFDHLKSNCNISLPEKQWHLKQNCVFDYTTVVVYGRVKILLSGLATQVGWLSLLQQTVLMVHNRCVIEVFGGLFMLSLCFSDFSVGVGTFLHV